VDELLDELVAGVAAVAAVFAGAGVVEAEVEPAGASFLSPAGGAGFSPSDADVGLSLSE
jgi:hypothetical protein